MLAWPGWPNYVPRTLSGTTGPATFIKAVSRSFFAGFSRDMKQEHDTHTMTVLNELMDSNGLTGESLLYRATLPEFLTPLGDTGAYSIYAKNDPSEAVVDVFLGLLTYTDLLRRVVRRPWRLL